MYLSISLSLYTSILVYIKLKQLYTWKTLQFQNNDLNIFECSCPLQVAPFSVYFWQIILSLKPPTKSQVAFSPALKGIVAQAFTHLYHQNEGTNAKEFVPGQKQ